MEQDEKRIDELNKLIRLNFEIYLKRRVRRESGGNIKKSK